MKAKQDRKTLQIDTDLHRRLKEHSDKTGMKLVAMVQRYLEKGLKEAKKQVS